MRSSIIFHATESILQLIWREGLSSPDLPAQVEGKNFLRNDALGPQVVEDGSGTRERHVGVAQAQDAIKSPIFQDLADLCPAQAKRLGLVDKAPNLPEMGAILCDCWEAGLGLGRGGGRRRGTPGVN